MRHKGLAKTDLSCSRTSTLWICSRISIVSVFRSALYTLRGEKSIRFTKSGTFADYQHRAGAHGYYTTTDSLEDLCLADVFKQGKACPVTVRFSTVGGESGSHDCARDPRGFSVKFRTEEGNWDVVANNTPVFFLRDPAKFPHFVSRPLETLESSLTQSDSHTKAPPIDTLDTYG